MKKWRDIIKKEDSIPWLLVFLGIFIGIFDYVEPALTKITESTEVLTKEELIILALNGVWVFLLLALIIILIKRAIGKDMRKSDKDKDERELMHDYLVAKSSYNILIFGLCIYVFFLSEDALRDYFILALMGVALIGRIIRRDRLEKEL